MRRKRKNDEEVSEGAPEWMTTYSDLVTLLLCFFVLLFSMANIDKQKFEAVAFSLRSSFMKISGGDHFGTNVGDTMISLMPYNKEEVLVENDNRENGSISDNSNMEEAKTDIEELVKDMGLDEHIKVIEENDVIILRFDSIVLFDSGSANMKASGMPVLDKIGTVLKSLEKEIFIQGHADDRPINTAEFPSNWELSTKRATNVVKYLVKDCGMWESLLTATGNAEFKPIVPNDSEYNRQKNRRIDIVIKK